MRHPLNLEEKNRCNFFGQWHKNINDEFQLNCAALRNSLRQENKPRLLEIYLTERFANTLIKNKNFSLLFVIIIRIFSEYAPLKQ